MRAETFVGGRNLLTPHAPGAYKDAGLLVVRPGSLWSVAVIVPNDGQSVLAQGGEKVYDYETVDGGQAQGFELSPGDRATLLRSGLPYSFVEWKVERAE